MGWELFVIAVIVLAAIVVGGVWSIEQRVAWWRARRARVYLRE